MTYRKTENGYYIFSAFDIDGILFEKTYISYHLKEAKMLFYNALKEHNRKLTY